MGLFDLFRKKDSAPGGLDKDLARLQKMAAGRLSQDFDRVEALERLSQLGSKDAVRILLQRFTWTLDPSIRDQEEKELVVDGIAKAGLEALGPLRDFCARAESLSWPLKGLRRVVTGDALEQELLSLLNLFDTEYLRNPEPKIQLLQALEEFSSPRVREAVEPFLEDSTEAVRFAAVTTIFKLDSAESLPKLLVVLKGDESLRIRNRVAEGIVERAWPVSSEGRELVGHSLPPGFSWDGERVVGKAAR